MNFIDIFYFLPLFTSLLYTFYLNQLRLFDTKPVFYAAVIMCFVPVLNIYFVFGAVRFFFFGYNK